MARLFSTSADESRVFKNQSALMPSFAPSALLHREAQILEIASALKPALSKARPQNLLIHGPTGTGKTSCARHVISQLSEYDAKVACIYVNCWENPSRQSILSVIAQKLKEALPRRGLADDEIFGRLIERLKYEKKTLVLVLDEVDRLMHQGESELLYGLARAQENHGVVIGIIGITNVPEIFYSLDERIRSSIRFKEIAFEKYSPLQLKDILRERARDSLIPGSYSDEVIALCAAQGARNNGDARIAIDALLQSALKADAMGKNRVEISDVRLVIERSADASLMKNANLMGENELLLMNILKDARDLGKTLTSGEIYSQFNARRAKAGKAAISERQILNYIQMFEAARMISAQLADDPNSKSGKTKLIKLIR